MTDTPTTPPVRNKDWKNVGVDLPPSVGDIIRAAGGMDPKLGGMPYAMAAIIAALPWIAAELFKALPSREYKAFARNTEANMHAALDVITADDPVAEFHALFERAKRSVQ
jgi:hypothetical protein